MTALTSHAVTAAVAVFDRVLALGLCVAKGHHWAAPVGNSNVLVCTRCPRWRPTEPDWRSW